MEMFFAEHDTTKTGRRNLAFLVLFTPVFLLGIHMFTEGQTLPFPVAFVYLCGSVPIFLWLFHTIALLRSTGLQRWIISDSEIIYESPSPVLGQSFKIPISDFRSVDTDGDSDFAWCFSVTGEKHHLHIGQSGGYQFFRKLKRDQQRLADDPP
jgi:hypothetical protein